MSAQVKVLAVDDVEENLVALSAVLAELDIQLLTARSGEEALELLLQHAVAVALVDVKMPGMDGFELAELMRGAERTRDVPIIFLTASDREPARVFKGYEAGAVDYLFKPVDALLLRSKVGVFVELQRQRFQLAEQLEQLQQMLRLSDLFVAVLGHDLRNPLTGILANAAALQRRTQDDMTRTSAQRIRNSAERMSRLINQVLDFARARLQGGIPIQAREADLTELCRAAVDDLGTDAAKRLTVEITGATGGAWDPDRLLQTLSNLLGNALAHGGQERPIRLRVDGAAANEVRLQVCNEGVIPDAARDTLFQPFQRGEKSGEGGLGLGLYIVDQIVRGHGGRIEVTSDAAQGTCFEVVLPRYVKRSETSADADPSPPLRAFH